MYLNFNIKNQMITRTDFPTVVARSQNYLKARFSFSEEWASAIKTAIFSTENFTMHMLLNDDECDVPWEILQEPGVFTVSVVGGNLITVNTAEVIIRPTGYTAEHAPEDPTPDIYTQIIDRLDAVDGELAAADKLVEEANEAAEKSKSCAGASERYRKEAENACDEAIGASINAQNSAITAGEALIIAADSAKNAAKNAEEILIIKEEIDKTASDTNKAKEASEEAAKRAENAEEKAEKAAENILPDYQKTVEKVNKLMSVGVFIDSTGRFYYEED